jgi:hypothetical protein
MSKFLVTIVGDLLGDNTADYVAAHITGAASVLVPGLYDWDDVTATPSNDGSVIITATVTGDDVVPAGNPAGYAGQEVTGRFVIAYVMWAGDYWLTSDVFVFSPVSCLAVPQD